MMMKTMIQISPVILKSTTVMLQMTMMTKTKLGHLGSATVKVPLIVITKCVGLTVVKRDIRQTVMLPIGCFLCSCGFYLH